LTVNGNVTVLARPDTVPVAVMVTVCEPAGPSAGVNDQFQVPSIPFAAYVLVTDPTEALMVNGSPADENVPDLVASVPSLVVAPPDTDSDGGSNRKFAPK
jgi:hypothetical protein